MSAIYELIGRFVMRLVWFRFGSQLKIAGGVLAVIAAAVGFLLTRREPPEG